MLALSYDSRAAEVYRIHHARHRGAGCCWFEYRFYDKVKRVLNGQGLRAVQACSLRTVTQVGCVQRSPCEFAAIGAVGEAFKTSTLFEN